MPLKRVSSSIGMRSLNNLRKQGSRSAIKSVASRKSQGSSRNSNSNKNTDWGAVPPSARVDGKDGHRRHSDGAIDVPIAIIQSSGDSSGTPSEIDKEEGGRAVRVQPQQQNNMHQMQVQATMRQLEETQRRTLDTLSELNSSIRDLRFAVNNNRDWTVPLGLAPQSTGTPHRAACVRSLVSNGAASDTLTEVDPLDPDEGLDRKTVRLDGLEVYAVVSAVTAGTLVAVFDSYHPGDIVDLVSSGRFLEALMSIIFLVTGSVGIVCGLHCIFVFSLITMYGRTALGMDRDDALEVFFAGTGLQRYHGFKTFVGSLYALMCELIVVITSKISSNPAVHIAALLATAKLMHYVYIDTQSIMEKAGVIFAPPKQPDVEEEGVPKDSKERIELPGGNASDADEDDGGITASNHSSARNSARTTDRRKSLVKRGSAMHVPATELINGGGGGGVGKGGFRGSLSSAESVRRSQSNFSKDDAGSNDDDSYLIERLHNQMERRGTNESQDSFDIGPDLDSVGQHRAGHKQSQSGSLRRRMDRKSVKRSSMSIGAHDLIDAQKAAAQHDRRKANGGRGRGGRRSFMVKRQSAMNVAATDLFDS